MLLSQFFAIFKVARVGLSWVAAGICYCQCSPNGSYRNGVCRALWAVATPFYLITMPPSVVFGRDLWHKSPKKSRKVQKRAVLIKKSKIFMKAKLTVSKSCLLGPACFMICCILGVAHTQNLCFLRGLLTEFIFFNFSDIATYPRKLGNQN